MIPLPRNAPRFQVAPPPMPVRGRKGRIPRAAGPARRAPARPPELAQTTDCISHHSSHISAAHYHLDMPPTLSSPAPNMCTTFVKSAQPLTMPYLDNGVSSALNLYGNRSGSSSPFQIR